MIRPTDLPLSTSWPPSAGAAPRAQAADPAAWFRGDEPGAAPRIGAAFDPACRGLSVAQHAERVLAHLFGTRDHRA